MSELAHFPIPMNVLLSKAVWFKWLLFVICCATNVQTKEKQIQCLSLLLSLSHPS